LTTVRRRVFQLLEVGAASDPASRAVDLGIGLLILANVLALLWESTEAAGADLSFYRTFEQVSVTVFGLEYLLRLWVAPEHPAFRGVVLGRLRWTLSPLALLDLLAILPALLSPLWASGVDLRAVRALRILRILRIAKLGRYSIAMQAIARALREKSSELASVVFLLLVVLTVASSMMYYVEHDANPGAFPSIPAAMWWGIATLTTVGYGDVVPTTGLGKLLGAGIAILGIGLFALPAAILSSSFTEQLRRAARPQRDRRCPHCGEDLGSPPPI
jgi:voltage-gated potassium channel